MIISTAIYCQMLFLLVFTVVAVDFLYLLFTGANLKGAGGRENEKTK